MPCSLIMVSIRKISFSVNNLLLDSDMRLLRISSSSSLRMLFIVSMDKSNVMASVSLKRMLLVKVTWFMV